MPALALSAHHEPRHYTRSQQIQRDEPKEFKSNVELARGNLSNGRNLHLPSAGEESRAGGAILTDRNTVEDDLETLNDYL